MSAIPAELFQPHPNRLVIIGAGIVGAHLAQCLTSPPYATSDRQVVVIDRSLTPLLGSTGHAPGFVGQLNSVAALTTLAKRSVETYRRVPGGFEVVGGMEVACTEQAVEVLKERREMAMQYGLEAELLDPKAAKGVAPAFVDEFRTIAALFYPSDGTANAGVLTATASEAAKANGAVLVEGDVVSIEQENGSVNGVHTSAGFLPATDVVLATGIWASQLVPSLPVLPVAHPYIHSTPRGPRTGSPSPFVRWPEFHVYARDHGTCDGLGTYDHVPIAEDALGEEAIGTWPAEEVFDEALASAYTHLPAGEQGRFAGGKQFNGIFSTTPDNLPLVGAVRGVAGLWAAVAVWVTHGAGSAELLAGLISGNGGKEGDAELVKALDPSRFEGQPASELRNASLRAYNDIYNRDQ
ncbi:N,N-dimethylglycine oxidase [Pseudohyphozyma bogoriensis]|nr:N,N-dimethylglycine oxidase [Pseudohyphozyma bogoriensis]